MNYFKASLMPLLVFFNINCMQQNKSFEEQKYEQKITETSLKLKELKNSLIEKANPSIIEKLITELQAIKQNTSNILELWKNAIQPQKASLLGNAESAARIVDLQVQNLVRSNRPIPQALQEQHANARTNLHLVKDYLYGYEESLRKLSRGWRSH